MGQNVFKILLVGILLLLLFPIGMRYLSTYSPSIPKINLTEHDVRQVILTELKADEQTPFLVSGTLHLVADITEENTKYLLPELFEDNFSLGTTWSNVRLPGKVSYGVDLNQLNLERIQVMADSQIVITLDQIEIQSVEAFLDEMEVHTEVGWARLHSRSGRSIERKALVEAQNALRGQAVTYLQTNTQPLRNTEMALSQILSPVLQSVGIRNPIIRCRLAPAFVEPIR